ncbi:hypothetical protein GCM10027030_15330 [Luteococcus sediminum]
MVFLRWPANTWLGFAGMLQGDVFTTDLIETWVDIKRAEIDELRQRVHPYEFDLYFAI